MLEDIKNAKDIFLDNFYLHCIIYGKPKSAKRHIGCSFPFPFIFDIDNGMLSMRGSDTPYKVYKSSFEVVNDLNKIANMKDCPYKTIVVSSITTLQEYLLKEIVKLNTKAVLDISNPFNANLNIKAGATLGDRGIRIDWLRNLVLQLSKMPFNTVILAHEVTEKDEIFGSITTQPLIAGNSLPKELPVYVDEIYKTVVSRGEDGKTHYGLLTVGDESMIAGSRLGVLPRLIDVTVDLSNNEKCNAYNILMDYVSGVRKK